MLDVALDVALGRDDRGLPPSPPEHRTAVVLAALFHDAIYDPASATNEADSADLATEVLSRLAADPQGAADPRGTVDPALVAEVARLVLLTRQHRCPAGDAAGAALLDADLAVLARDPCGPPDTRRPADCRGAGPRQPPT